MRVGSYEYDREKNIDTTFLEKMEMEGLGYFPDRGFEQFPTKKSVILTSCIKSGGAARGTTVSLI